MLTFKRSAANPIVAPDTNTPWEALAAFNGCPVKQNHTYHLLYRALSEKVKHHDIHMELSTIGYTKSRDGIHFGEHRQIIIPQYDWELYGCEDPRVTAIGNTFYIFYTALSTFPFTPAGIHIGMAITKDFKKFEKHSVTPFNSKAMTLFPEKINGKYVVLLTANTDIPPSMICLAQCTNISDLWSLDFWDDWYRDIHQHRLPLLRGQLDHIEVGAPPMKTKKGWLVLYSYIQNYQTQNKTFGIEAVLLDLKNPSKIIGKITEPLIQPKEYYEKFGVIPNITFPSGALIEGDTLNLYYGAADTVCAVASCSIKDLLAEFSST
jgi:beta-1,2-mannobiose phosphorylase / 1,2-beta-oligomannan phosphorylase